MQRKSNSTSMLPLLHNPVHTPTSICVHHQMMAMTKKHHHPFAALQSHQIDTSLHAARAQHMYLKSPLGVTLLSAQQPAQQKTPSHSVTQTHTNTQAEGYWWLLLLKGQHGGTEMPKNKFPLQQQHQHPCVAQQSSNTKRCDSCLQPPRQTQPPTKPQPTVSNPNQNDVTSAKVAGNCRTKE